MRRWPLLIFAATRDEPADRYTDRRNGVRYRGRVQNAGRASGARVAHEGCRRLQT